MACVGVCLALVHLCRIEIPAHTPRSPPMHNLAAPAGRILIALIFLLSGIDKIVHYAPTLGYMQKAGLPFPEPLLIDFGIMQCTPLRTSTICDTRQSPTIETSE